MSSFTAYIESQIAEWMSQGIQMDTPPGTIYVALHTGDPGNDGTLSEVSATDYSRISTTAGTDWNVQSGDGPTTFVNGTNFEFGVAGSSWGEITHASLWDSETGGNAIGTYQISNPKTIETDDEARFPAGDMTFNID